MKNLLLFLFALISFNAYSQMTTYVTDTTAVEYPLFVKKKKSITELDTLGINLSAYDIQLEILKNDINQLTVMVAELQSQAPTPNQFFFVRNSVDTRLTITVGDDNAFIISRSTAPVTVVLGNLPAGVRVWIRRDSAPDITLPNSVKSKANLRKIQRNGTVQLTSEGNGVWSAQGDLQ